jgi:hypothetical protein
MPTPIMNPELSEWKSEEMRGLSVYAFNLQINLNIKISVSLWSGSSRRVCGVGVKLHDSPFFVTGKYIGMILIVLYH